jgi:accessory gene regulator B
MEEKAQLLNLWHIEKRMSTWLVGKLPIHKEHDQNLYIKVKFGADVFMNNLLKTLIIYGMALYFELFMGTLIFHVSFLLIRRYAYGRHAKNTFHCVCTSILLFLCIPYLIRQVVLPFPILMIQNIFTLTILAIFAPGVTAKNKIRDEKKKQELRKKVRITGIVLIVIQVLLPITMTNLIASGMLFAACLTINKKEVEYDKIKR